MKNQKVPTALGIAIITILAITVAVLTWKCENNNQNIISSQGSVTQQNANSINQNHQPNDVKDNNQSAEQKPTEEVSFCGKTYKTEIIILDNIDVIKRIARFSQNNVNRICENIATNSTTGDLSVKFFKQKTTDVDYKDGVYFLNIGIQFKIDLNTNSIYTLSGYDGEPTFFGKLK